jgi:hypothetical protein
VQSTRVVRKLDGGEIPWPTLAFIRALRRELAAKDAVFRSRVRPMGIRALLRKGGAVRVAADVEPEDERSAEAIVDAAFRAALRQVGFEIVEEIVSSEDVPLPLGFALPKL